MSRLSRVEASGSCHLASCVIDNWNLLYEKTLKNQPKDRHTGKLEGSIESLIISGITKYTGLSASNTSYSFWAGSGVSGGYSLDSTEDAKFSVTP